MSSYPATTTFRHEGGLSGALKTLATEVSAFLDAILYPGKIIGEVQQMRTLLLEAQRIEASDPARAAALRRRAARIGR